MSHNEEKPWRSTAYGIILSEGKDRIFLLREGQRYLLPSVKVDGGAWESRADKVHAGFQKAAGGRLHVLFRSCYEEDRSNKTTESHYVLEPLESPSAPGRWATSSELTNIQNMNEKQRQIAADTLEDVGRKPAPEARPPWARQGWFREAATWIEDTLMASGQRMAADIEPVKIWSLSCVMRARSDGGDYYFKTSADLPLFVNEAAAVSFLGELFPDNIPSKLAAEFDQDWLLMSDCGEIVGWNAAVEKRKGFIEQFGAIQRDSIADIDQLLQNGCLDRRVDWLESRIDQLFSSPESQKSLSENEYRRLKSESEKFKDLCGLLSEFKIPDTLVHGDLHGGNVAQNNGNYVYFDWTDASISHPFFDMLDIFLEKEPKTRLELRDHYLKGWAGFGSKDSLLTAWEISKVLASLHHAISYHEIVVNIEPRSRFEIEWGVGFWLRKALENLDLLRTKYV